VETKFKEPIKAIIWTKQAHSYRISRRNFFLQDRVFQRNDPWANALEITDAGLHSD